MEKDDDEVVDVAISVVRYQIMPSLVALQTMRNRLHLAFLGKKLMKWTALATGKELRRLSLEMSSVIVDYGGLISNAFMMLARCRFHEPALNVIVLECVPPTARLSVKLTTRSVAGVKVISLDVEETGKDGYGLLGVGKGGEIIKQTKKVWLELLKIMVLMCQFRLTFMMVDAANRAANKKQNVLQRLIIPKIRLTMAYILSELDEQEREESFRLKRFKQLKHKNDTFTQPVIFEEESETELKPVKPTTPPVVIPAPPKEIEPPKKPEEPAVKVPEPRIPDPAELAVIMNHINEVVRLVELLQSAALIPKHFGLTRCDLNRLKLQLHEALKLSQSSRDRQQCVICESLGKTLSSCDCSAPVDKPAPSTMDLELLTRPGYAAAMKLLPKTKVATPMPDYIMKPRARGIQDTDIKPDANARLNDLEKHVDQVICLTHCYKRDGVLSKSAENFLKCCQSVKTKIQEIKDQRKVKAKLSRLKEHVEQLEQITNIVQKEELSTSSISSFMSCCKDFKTKIDCRQSSKGAPSVCSIENLVKRIDISIELSKEAKMEGLVSESVEEFIKTCKEIKGKIDAQDDSKPKVIHDLLFNLNDIMKCISKYKHDGLLSDSIENFYTTCQTTKAKLDSYKPCCAESNYRRMSVKLESELCPMCRGPTKTESEMAYKCSKCKNRVSGKKESQHSLGKDSQFSGNKTFPGETPCSQTASRHGSQDKYSCPLCNKQKSELSCKPKPSDSSEKGRKTPPGYKKVPGGTTCSQTPSKHGSQDQYSCPRCEVLEKRKSQLSCKSKPSDSFEKRSWPGMLLEYKTDPAGSTHSQTASRHGSQEKYSCPGCKLPDKQKSQLSCTSKTPSGYNTGSEKTTCSRTPSRHGSQDKYSHAQYKNLEKMLSQISCKIRSTQSCHKPVESLCRCTSSKAAAPAPAAKTCNCSDKLTKGILQGPCQPKRPGKQLSPSFSKSTSSQASTPGSAKHICGCSLKPDIQTSQNSCKDKSPQNCTKCMKQQLYCKSTSSQVSVKECCKSSESVDNKGKNKCISKRPKDDHAPTYTALISAKPESFRSCKSNSLQPYVPKRNKPKCKSLQSINLDKTNCKECDGNKDQKAGLNCKTESLPIVTIIESIFKYSNAESIKPCTRKSLTSSRVTGSCESVISTKIFCNAPTTKGFIQIVRNVKSEILIRTQDLSDSHQTCLWSRKSAESLTSQDKNNESDSAQLDIFFCCNSSTSHDDSGSIVPL